MDPLRTDRPETIVELERQLGRLFPQAKTHRRIWSPSHKLGLSTPTQILIPIAPSADAGTAIELSSMRSFDEHEVRLSSIYGDVFNADLASAPMLGRHAELWLSLQQTRMARVIARFTSFHTPMFLKWLRAIENALSLRYEGQPFATHLILTKQMEWIRDNPLISYVSFSERISITKALFEEKWTRSLAADGELSLVGLGHDRGVVGVMYANAPADHWRGALVPPHSNLVTFCSVLVPGTIGFLASPRGDLRVLMPNGASFVKSQGHWAMVNLHLLQSALTTMLEEPVANSVMRLAADLSYEGHGALLCCVENRRSVQDLAPDHTAKDRPGRSLRLMGRKLNVTNTGHQKILKSVAKIDGAVILDAKGEVLDCACMISDPTDPMLTAAGLTERRRFPGARSTAAWNASLHGISIKISEDGPITLFRKGEVLLEL